MHLEVKPPTLAELTEVQREQAMARFRILRSHMERGVPLSRAAQAGGVGCEPWSDGSLSIVPTVWARVSAKLLLDGGYESSPPNLELWRNTRAFCGLTAVRSHTDIIAHRPLSKASDATSPSVYVSLRMICNHRDTQLSRTVIQRPELPDGF